ncbi:GntR family transcriptional regulator [Arthrobacter sp. 35W]|uniref:GntR family transcriptional regulator n=1 Tax=Arthrobacter sp. 35W TaxID=1132441 RepID=UPI0018CA1DAC|nr:GntR family transcriptional regulator [Arthrobacter sp. 35W]
MTGFIQAGSLPPGSKLPAERQLASALGISRMTLRQALDTLAHEGRLTRALGGRGGSFIAEPRVPVDISNLMGLSAQLLKSVDSAASRLLDAGTVPAGTSVAEALHVPVGAAVHRIRRLRFAASTPVVLEDSYFPADLFPGMLERPLTGSLYALMGMDYSLAPCSSTEELNPAVAGPAVATLLDISPRTPVLAITRTALSADGRPVEYSRDIVRTDRLRIIVSGRVEAQGEQPTGA